MNLMQLNLQNRYAQNRYQQNKKLFGDTFYLTHQGCRRPIWYILIVCRMDELSEEQFQRIYYLQLTENKILLSLLIIQ